jgi:hypothetical protein
MRRVASLFNVSGLIDRWRVVFPHRAKERLMASRGTVARQVSVREREVAEGGWALAGLLAIAVGLGGCGGGSGTGGSSISSQPLSGMIDGQPWAFVAGQTDAFLSSTGTNFFANLFDMALDMPCTELQPAGATRSLILNIPKAVGHYSITAALNQTLAYQDPSIPNNGFQNDIAYSGELDVTELTATTIKGGVEMSSGTKDSVDGQFEITLCTN